MSDEPREPDYMAPLHHALLQVPRPAQLTKSDWLEQWAMPALAPVPWHRRIRNRYRYRLRYDVRERLALWIAPWLDHDD